MKHEDRIVEALRKRLGREPTVREFDEEIFRIARPHTPPPAPYVCHCGRLDCSIDWEDE